MLVPYPPDPPMPPFRLPEALACADGHRVASAAEWRAALRPTTLELFRRHVYGRVPQTPFDVRSTVVDEDTKAMDLRATRRLIDVRVARARRAHTFRVQLFVPNRVGKRVPAFLFLCSRGAEHIDPTRQQRSPFWPAEAGVARGYAMAALDVAEVDPDVDDGFRNGIHPVLDGERRGPDSWGTLAAWAFGASRALDYLVTDPDLAPDRVAVIGHSRGGKAALWAGAEDERFALVVANESGAGGAALSRRRFVGRESVAALNARFRHWFCAGFRAFDDREDELPVDQHQLIALMAPRAVAIGSASENLWADPRGEFLGLREAQPVYRLLGRAGLPADEMPPIGAAINGDVAHYHLRAGAHDLTLDDWQHYWDFADRVLR